MTYEEAIENLIDTCGKFKIAIEQLQEENAFLTDTIEKNNLNSIVLERRSLLKENAQCKEDADIAVMSAKQIINEYETKISEANVRLSDARKKQTDINFYINAEAEKKIINIKYEYEKQKTANDESLKQYRAESDRRLQEMEIIYKKRNKKYLIVALASIVLAGLGIVINFV